MCRLMQLSEQTFPATTMFNNLFNSSKTINLLEFIDDFPNDAEINSSLQAHPMGWWVLFRNVIEQANEQVCKNNNDKKLTTTWSPNPTITFFICPIVDRSHRYVCIFFWSYRCFLVWKPKMRKILGRQAKEMVIMWRKPYMKEKRFLLQGVAAALNISIKVSKL